MILNYYLFLLFVSIRRLSSFHHYAGQFRQYYHRAQLPINYASISELPNDFDNAIDIATKRTIECFESGTTTCRIDFDTTIGDQTYTSIKNSMPMLKLLVNKLAKYMKLYYYTQPTIKNQANANVVPVDGSLSVNFSNDEDDLSIVDEIEIQKALAIPNATLRLFFPDMGAAVLARNDWKMNSPASQVPSSIFTANIQNDRLEKSDKLAIIVCPLYSEADYVKRVIDMCDEQNIPTILINPELVNMDQGYGVRAKNIKKLILSRFVTTYKLKTLSKGALVREWPNDYTLWIEDMTQEGGYRLLQSYTNEPTREEISDIFEAAEGNNLKASSASDDSKKGNAFGELVGFFKGLSKL
eukprot:gene13884-18618_t